MYMYIFLQTYMYDNVVLVCFSCMMRFVADYRFVANVASGSAEEAVNIILAAAARVSALYERMVLTIGTRQVTNIGLR